MLLMDQQLSFKGIYSMWWIWQGFIPVYLLLEEPQDALLA